MRQATTVRVMLVDDHAIVREGYRRLLQAEPGIDVVSEHANAEAARQALSALGEDAVDVVVMDLSMPGRGGLDMTHRITQRWPRVRVLMFSMHDQPTMVARALEAGAAGYVTKTTAPDDLVQAVRRVAAGEVGVLSDDVAQALKAPTAQPPHATLSPREFDVLRLLLAGLSVELIAARLSLSSKTVSNVQTAIRTKLGVGTAVDLLRYAQQHNLVAP